MTTLVSQTPADKKVDIKILREGKTEMTVTTTIAKQEEEKEEQVSQGGREENGVSSDVLGLTVRPLTGEDSKSESQKADKGVVIIRVEPESAAEYNDIRAGDVLYEVNGETLHNVEDYKKITKNLKKGNIVRLLIGRDAMTIFIAYRL